MRCRAAFTCFAYGCVSVVLSVPMLAAAAETDSLWLKATEGSLFADGFEVGDPSMWTRSEPNGTTVGSVAPDNGVAGGGDMLTITGSQFTGTSNVELDGVSCISWLVTDDGHISCQTPPHVPAIVRLTVWRDSGHGTLTDGFRFTGEDDLLVVDWAAVQWPQSVTCSAGTTMETISGVAHSSGFTDRVGPPGSSVVAEVGWGPAATHPGRDPGWLWFDAPWFADFESDSDEFRGAPPCPPPGTWALAFRCSADGGLTSLYGDFYPGTADGFEVSDLVVLVSQ